MNNKQPISEITAKSINPLLVQLIKRILSKQRISCQQRFNPVLIHQKIPAAFTPPETSYIGHVLYRKWYGIQLPFLLLISKQ
jgi:hypothetical protein